MFSGVLIDSERFMKVLRRSLTYAVLKHCEAFSLRLLTILWHYLIFQIVVRCSKAFS